MSATSRLAADFGDVPGYLMPHLRLADAVNGFLQRVFEIEGYIQNCHRARKESDDLCQLWFRGSADADYGLEPSLYRGFANTRDALEKEDELRLQFKRQGRQMLGAQEQPSTEWEWYFLMRHHYAPTRLLDWTDGALTALFFAVSNLDGCPDNGKDKAVWILDPEWLNERTVGNDSVLLTDWHEAMPYLPTPLFEGGVPPELPVAIDPPHIAPRVAAQRSRFTIHGTRSDGIEAVSSQAGSESRLFKLIIPNKSVQKIKEQLTRCGITSTTLFPDLDALGRELAANLTRHVAARDGPGANGPKDSKKSQ